eukprot:14028993-Alexandrium_andersonii.AAC.1
MEKRRAALLRSAKHTRCKTARGVAPPGPFPYQGREHEPTFGISSPPPNSITCHACDVHFTP